MARFLSLQFWLATAGCLALGAVLSLLDGAAFELQGWLGYSLLAGLGIGAIFAVRRLTGAYPAGSAAFTAFGLRLAIGVILFLLFPAAGYPDARATLAGYAFEDAFFRDQSAYLLARSGDPIAVAFTNQYSGDQYGGMLAMSAAIYRYLSPGVHRPMLILILTAAAAGAGVLFTWKAAANWFGGAVGALAGWIFALYPESVLLGSSHMREAFVMAAVAMTFYSLTILWNGRLTWAAWMAAAGVVLLLFQPPVGLFAFAVVGLAWFFDPHQRPSWKQASIFAGIMALSIIVVVSAWASLPSLEGERASSIFFTWLQNNFTFQAHKMERGSGMFQELLRGIGEWGKLPVVLAYGVAQPVLPAALGDKPEVALIWRVINIFRAAGWYALALFLVYGLFGVFRPSLDKRRPQLIWLAVAIWIWILLAAANGGGNQWDNPRYRTMLLAWLALLVAWAWHSAHERRDVWLPRWMMVEAVFVSLFTVWYIGRNYIKALHMSIWTVIALTLISSGMILLSGFLWDRRLRR